MSVANTERIGRRSSIAFAPAWLFAGAGVYLLLLIRGDSLLNDPDMFWQIKIGQWIAANHAVPSPTSIPSLAPANPGRHRHGCRRCCSRRRSISAAGPAS